MPMPTDKDVQKIILQLFLLPYYIIAALALWIWKKITK